MILMRLVRSEKFMSDDELDEDCEVRQADDDVDDELDKIRKVGESNAPERVRLMTKINDN